MSTRDEDARTIISALALARERVTADSVAVKQKKRDDLGSMISAVRRYGDTGEGRPPSARKIRDLLGDPDDKPVRDALDRWG